MRSIALKLPNALAEECGRFAARLELTRAAYIRMAIRSLNRKTAASLRAERMAAVCRRVRGESRNVNAQFAAVERDPDA